MRVQLHSGGEAHVFVRFEDVQVPRKHGKEVVTLRGTTMHITMPDGREFTAGAVCKPPDVFTRKAGRSHASRHMAEILRHEVSREDRKAIFDRVWRPAAPPLPPAA